MGDLGQEHMSVFKLILRYIKGTLNVGLVYVKVTRKCRCISRYVDADFAGDLNKGRSQTIYIFISLGNAMN